MTRKLILILALIAGCALLAGLATYVVRAYLPFPKTFERNESISAALDKHPYWSADHDPSAAPAQGPP